MLNPHFLWVNRNRKGVVLNSTFKLAKMRMSLFSFFFFFSVLCSGRSQWNTERLHYQWHLDHVWLLSSGDHHFLSHSLDKWKVVYAWCHMMSCGPLHLPAEQNSDSSIWLPSDRHAVFKSHEEHTKIPLISSIV